MDGIISILVLLKIVKQTVFQQQLSINSFNISYNETKNIVSTIFKTEYYSEKELSELIVTNILGEQVYFESIKSIGDISTKIDLSDNSKGVYNLTIKT